MNEILPIMFSLWTSVFAGTHFGIFWLIGKHGAVLLIEKDPIILTGEAITSIIVAITGLAYAIYRIIKLWRGGKSDVSSKKDGKSN